MIQKMVDEKIFVRIREKNEDQGSYEIDGKTIGVKGRGKETRS